jgi:hypothetical protein
MDSERTRAEPPIGAACELGLMVLVLAQIRIICSLAGVTI